MAIGSNIVKLYDDMATKGLFKGRKDRNLSNMHKGKVRDFGDQFQDEYSKLYGQYQREMRQQNRHNGTYKKGDINSIAKRRAERDVLNAVMDNMRSNGNFKMGSKKRIRNQLNQKFENANNRTFNAKNMGDRYDAVNNKGDISYKDYKQKRGGKDKIQQMKAEGKDTSRMEYAMNRSTQQKKNDRLKRQLQTQRANRQQTTRNIPGSNSPSPAQPTVKSNEAKNKIETNKSAKRWFQDPVMAKMGVTQAANRIRRFNRDNPDASFGDKAWEYTKAGADAYWNGGTKGAKIGKRVGAVAAPVLIGDAAHDSYDANGNKDITGIPFL